VRDLGGLAAIAISHPHFYASMIEWSHRFGRVPVYLHAADRQWVMRPDPVIEHWEGESRAILPGVAMIRCGGHFPGSSVLHWDRGALLTGDTIMVVPDRAHVSFMWSYPNLVPLPASEVRRITAAVRPYGYDRIYGGWWDRVIASGAKAAVEASAARYLARVGRSSGGAPTPP
jgi:glyoxylase-like metal-dependent hydrolase (beta-lactamase superfamily II)